jgi:hypothetical protein
MNLKYYIAHRILIHQDRTAARVTAQTWCRYYDRNPADALNAARNVFNMFKHLHDATYHPGTCHLWPECHKAAARGYTALINFDYDLTDNPS